MSPKLVCIMTVGVAITALQTLSIKGLREDMGKRFAALDQRVGALEQRLARLEGMIDGLFNCTLKSKRPQPPFPSLGGNSTAK